MTQKQTQTVHRKIAEYIRRHDDQTLAEISTYLGVSIPMLSDIARKHGVCRGDAKNSYAARPDLLLKLEQ